MVEVRSPSDSVAALHAKMREWIDNDVRLTWLVDPFNRQAVVYRADGSVEDHGIDATLPGEDVLPRFAFDLRKLPVGPE